MQVEMWHKDSKESVMVHKLKVDGMKSSGWTTQKTAKTIEQLKKTKEVNTNG